MAARRAPRPKGKHVGFKKLKGELAAKGVRDPGGLAATIGRRKYGKAGFAAMSAAGRKKASGKRKGK